MAAHQAQGSVVSAGDLRTGDRIDNGVNIGPFTTTARLRVKSVVPGDYDKVGVTFFGIGTIFIHKDLLVQLVAGDDD